MEIKDALIGRYGSRVRGSDQQEFHRTLESPVQSTEKDRANKKGLEVAYDV